MVWKWNTFRKGTSVRRTLLFLWSAGRICESFHFVNLTDTGKGIYNRKGRENAGERKRLSAADGDCKPFRICCITDWNFSRTAVPFIIRITGCLPAGRFRQEKELCAVRKNFGKKSWMYPLPVLIIATYNEDGTADAMNAAWGGLYDADKVVLCLSAGHKTTANIKARKAFTISFADAAHVVESDYVGIVSANTVPDKLDRAGFHTTKSSFVDAPLIDELPMALECRLIEINKDGNVIGEIVNVSAEESILDTDGSVDPEKLRPLVFDPVRGAYCVLGEKVGNAFQDGKKLKG